MIRIFSCVICRGLFVLSASACGESRDAGDMPVAIAAHLLKQGPVISQQILQSHRPVEQMVLSYCVDENLQGGTNEGASNPANVHCEAALFVMENGWALADEISLGQGSITEFTGAVLRGVAVTYAPADPLCCPGEISALTFTTANGKFVQLSEE